MSFVGMLLRDVAEYQLPASYERAYEVGPVRVTLDAFISQNSAPRELRVYLHGKLETAILGYICDPANWSCPDTLVANNA